MIGTTSLVRPLVASDLSSLRRIADRNPLVNLFVRSRLDHAGTDPRWLASQILGYFEDGELVSACHAGANVVPVEASGQALDAFAEHLSVQRRAWSIVGERGSVVELWNRLEPTWGPARSPRLDQPFMVLDHDSDIDPDPRVRRFVIDEIDLVYPACVDMFREEVGVNPEVEGGGYKARVAQLLTHGWSFGIIEDGSVLFKAEVGALAGNACQVQGVYIRPDQRGQGLAAAALSALVREVRREVAPVVTLYVNDHNVAARRAYERVGFEQTTTFASILF